MDQRITRAVEDYVHAGFPTDAAAVLLAEVDGLDAGVAIDADAIADIGAAPRRDAGARRRRPMPSGSCCGRAARRRSVRSPGSRPTTTSTTPSCPGRGWPRCCAQVYEIAERHDLIVMNVFHAGDGNLHPLLLFDAREPGVLERVHAAGRRDHRRVARRRRRAVGRARHRPREAATYMALHVLRRRPRPPGPAARGVRPDVSAEPGQGAARWAQLRRHPGAAQRADGGVGMTATLVDHDAALLAFADEVGADGPVAVRGGGDALGPRRPLAPRHADRARSRPASCLRSPRR